MTDQQQSYFTADFSIGNFVVISSLGPNIPAISVYRWLYKDGEYLKTFSLTNIPTK